METNKYRYFSKCITILQEGDLKIRLRVFPYDNKVLYSIRNLDVEIYDIPTFKEAVEIYNKLKNEW